MSFVQWTPAMSVGVPELDDDHKLLVRVINQLAAHADRGSHPAVIRQCLYAMMRHAEYHFVREESVMAACDFPELAAHSDEHRRFENRIRALGEIFEAAEISVGATGTAANVNLGHRCEAINRELLDFLRHWLDDHVLGVDMAYRPFVENRPDARKAAKRHKAA